MLGNPCKQVEGNPIAGHLPALGGLRGLAILLVLWNHFGPLAHHVPWHGLRLSLYNLSGAGWAGVDLFFVLSGFLITGKLLDAREDCLKGPPGEIGRAGSFFGRFYARRALRVFPLYYLVLTAVAVVTSLRRDPSQQQIFNDLAPWLWCFLSNVFNANNGWKAGPHGLILNHFWSLAVEEQFYLVWPIIVYLCKRRVLLSGCFATIGLAVALRYFCEVVQGNNYAAMLLTPCRMDALAIGAILALAVRSARPEQLARLGLWMTGAGILLVPAFCDYLWVDLIGRTILAVMFGGLILLALFTRLARVFELRVLQVFGKYSYGLYVLHFLLYHVIDLHFPADRLGTLGRFAGCTMVSFALAYASWHFVEKHFLKLSYRQGRSPTTGTSETVVAVCVGPLNAAGMGAGV